MLIEEQKNLAWPGYLSKLEPLPVIKSPPVASSRLPAGGLISIRTEEAVHRDTPGPPFPARVDLLRREIIIRGALIKRCVPVYVRTKHTGLEERCIGNAGIGGAPRHHVAGPGAECFRCNLIESIRDW